MDKQSENKLAPCHSVPLSSNLVVSYNVSLNHDWLVLKSIYNVFSSNVQNLLGNTVPLNTFMTNMHIYVLGFN